ncbi:MAG: hypothetical protein WC966_05765, partial [Bradymonadales bacterium]
FSAIAHNPYLAVGDCLRLLPTLGTNTLKSLAAQNLMHPIVISTIENYFELLNRAFKLNPNNAPPF